MSNLIQTVQVEGREVLNFMPQSVSQGTIVPLSVIQRLAAQLQSSSLHNIVRDMSNNLRNSPINSIEDYLKLLQDEIDFHNTVNLLTEYQPEEDAALIADRETEYAIAHQL